MLPDLNTDERDQKAMVKAMTEALEPVAEEISDLVSTMRRAYPDVSEKQFRAEALNYTVDRLREAVEEMTSKDGGMVTSADVIGMLDGFSKKSTAEQKKLLGEMLKNDKFQTELLKGIEKTFADEMLITLHKLLDIEQLSLKDQKAAREELKKFEEDRARRMRESESKNAGRIDIRKLSSEDTLSDKILDFLHKMTGGGLFRDLAQIFSDLGLLVGAGGLLSMLPETFRKFVGDFTAAFQTISTLLRASWLEPIFKILETIPILGAILKKIPYLNALLAAMEIIPEIAKKFSKEGIWGAIEAGLKGIVKFFVIDVIDLVGQLADYIEKKVFNIDIFDFSSVAKNFQKTTSDTIDSWIKTFKLLFQGEFIEAGKNIFKGMLTFFDDTIQMIVEFFHVKEDWKILISDMAQKVKNTLADSINAAMSRVIDVKDWIVNGVIDSWNFIEKTVKDKFTEATTAVIDIKDRVVKLLEDTWTAIKDAIWTAFTAALASITDLKDRITQWLDDIVNSVMKKLTDSIPGPIKGALGMDSPMKSYEEVFKEPAPDIMTNPAIPPKAKDVIKESIYGAQKHQTMSEIIGLNAKSRMSMPEGQINVPPKISSTTVNNNTHYHSTSKKASPASPLSSSIGNAR